MLLQEYIQNGHEIHCTMIVAVKYLCFKMCSGMKNVKCIPCKETCLKLVDCIKELLTKQFMSYNQEVKGIKFPQINFCELNDQQNWRHWRSEIFVNVVNSADHNNDVIKMVTKMEIITSYTRLTDNLKSKNFHLLLQYANLNEVIQ